MIIITSFGEFILYYCQFFFISIYCEKKKSVLQDCFYVGLCCPVCAGGIHVLVDLN